MKTKSFSKRIVSAMLAMIMVMAMIPSVSVLAREYAAEVSINGVTVDFKNQPYSKNDIIYVPLEEIGGYLNLNMTKEGNVFNLVRMGQTLKVESGNMVAFLDGKEVMLSSNPVEKNGVTYIPVDLFSAGFGCPVTVGEDKRSADIIPNVYKVAVTENTAAAVSAAVPDKDILATGTSGVDTLFNNAAVFPQLEKSLFYMFDLSAFSGLKIEKALLSINIDKAEYSPTLRIERTAPWVKGTVTYNTQPVSYEKEYVTGTVAESNYVDKQYNIVSLVNAAQTAGETLAIKLLGIPNASKKNSDKNSFTIRGVNHAKAPYLEIYVQETYTFPVKANAAAQEESDEYQYSKLALLKSLGVFTQEDEFPLDLSEGVQRQEFVRYALRLRNATLQDGSGEQFFSDVPVDAPFYKEVMTAHSMGLVAGWQGIAFRPYDRITMGEAITILGRMLNYNIFADERGGFTPGYFAAARNGDLYHGAEIEKEVLSFKKMFNLLEDALDAKMLNVRSYSSTGTAEYTFDANMTVLTEFWNAQVIEGQVTANEYSGLTNPDAGKEGIIEIDNGRKELKFTFEPYNEFLGYRVKAYYEKHEDKLLYMGIKEYDITKVDLCDITGPGPQDASTVTFIYKNGNGNTTKASFSKSNVIYNGKSIAAGNVSPELLNADGGSILLVGDSLAVINAYKTVTVYSVDQDAEVIYDKYDSYNNAVELKGKDYILCDTYGKDVEISTLNPDDILSVAKSYDGTLINAIVSTVKINGSITAAENLGTDSEILTINATEYRTRNHDRNEQDSIDEYWWDYIDIGASGTFLVDAFGSIVGFNPTKTKGVKGYFLTMGNKGSAISSKLQMAVMVEGSEKYVVYDLADKVKIDGTSYKVSSQETEVKNKFKDPTYGRQVGEYVTQGIIFDVNSDGKINNIDTAYYDENKEDENNSLQMPRTIDDGELHYGSNGSLGGMYYLKLSKNLGVFGYEEGNLNEYETKTGGFSNNAEYSLDIYTIGKRTPEAAIIYRVMDSKTDSSVGDDPYLMLVDRIVTTVDEDGFDIKKIYYYSGTSKNSIIVPDEMVSKLKKKTLTKPDSANYTGGTSNQQYKDDLAAYNDDPGNANVYNEITRGDIIRFETNDRGEVTAIEECYDITDSKIVVNRISSFNHHYRAYGGYTDMVEGSYIKITNPTDTTKYTWVDSSKFSGFYRYEATSAGVEVIPVTLKDVRTVENVPYDPTGILLYAAYENLRKNVWMIELDPPAGTGKYTLSYNLGEHGESYGQVPKTPVRCEPDCSIAVTGEKPAGKSDPEKNIAWEFSHWEDEDGNKVSGTITLTKNTVLTAKWDEIELPRYIYLKESKEAAESIEKKTVNKTDGVYKTTVPDVKKKDGTYYFTHEQSNKKYVDWVDGEGNIKIPGEPLTLSNDLTLYPNWYTEVTETFSGDKIQLLKVVQTVATDGSKTQKATAIDMAAQNYISEGSGTNVWYLAKVEVGENWDAFSAVSLSTKLGMYRTNTADKRGYNVGFGAPLDSASYESLAIGNTLTSLVKPLDNPVVTENVFAGSKNNGNYWAGSQNSAQTRSFGFDETAFGNDCYKDGYLYLAFQPLNRDESATEYERYLRLIFATKSGDDYKPEWKLTVTGGKKQKNTVVETIN